MNRQAFDELFQRYWDRLSDRFAKGEAITDAPLRGNHRRVEAISRNELRLREIAARASGSSTDRQTLRNEFWKLYTDPGLATDGVEALRTRHSIKNLSEFKRGMFEEFARFGNLGLSIGRTTPNVLPPDAYEPTADTVLLEERAKLLVAAGFDAVPEGNMHPARVAVNQTAFVRDPKVHAAVVVLSGGHCDACGDIGYELDDGSLFLEVHHVLPLSEGGPDVVSNAVAVCETCHGKLHKWKEREGLHKKLFKTVSRLKRYSATDDASAGQAYDR